MKISTKGRYALRMMLDLAAHQGDGYVALKDIAQRQEISLKYLERILPALVQAGEIEGVHGKGGGYRLTRAPKDYRVGDILRLTEGDLAPVACLGCDAKPCAREPQCRTIGMWRRFSEMTNAYFDGITIADLMQRVV